MMAFLSISVALTLLVMVESCSRSCPPNAGRGGGPGGPGMSRPPGSGPIMDESLPGFWSRPSPGAIICQATYTDFTPSCYRNTLCPNGMTCRGSENPDTNQPSYSYCFPEDGPHQGPPPPPPFICEMRFIGITESISRRCPTGLACPKSFSRPPGGSDYEFKVCKLELCPPQGP